MARAFRLSDDGRQVDGRLDADERELISTVLRQVRTLVVTMDPPLPESTGDDLEDSLAFLSVEPQPQSDPALQRLFPDAMREDRSAADDFRRITETSLRQRKVQGIDAALAALDAVTARSKVSFTPAEARALTVALTDVRLVLGARLGLQTDDDHERLVTLADAGSLDDQTEHGLRLYEFLTWLQESLAESLALRWERGQA